LAELNFGLVEIEWAAKRSPKVTMRAIGHDGSEGFTHCV